MSDPPTPDEVLVEMVRADLALREDTGERDSFRFTSPYSRNPLLRHNGFHRTGHEQGFLHVPRQVIEDMKEQHLVRIKVDKHRVSGSGRKSQTFEQWLVDVSTGGVERYRLLEQTHTGGTAETPAAGGVASLEWATDVLPVLQAAYEAAAEGSPDIGASQDAVNARMGREAGDVSTARSLLQLEQAGYLRETMGADQIVGPAFFTLTEKALQVVAGWPGGGGDAAYDRLLALLDERISAAGTPDERSQWERARDAVVGAGRDVLVEVLAAAATRGVNTAL